MSGCDGEGRLDRRNCRFTGRWSFLRGIAYVKVWRSRVCRTRTVQWSPVDIGQAGRINSSGPVAAAARRARRVAQDCGAGPEGIGRHRAFVDAGGCDRTRHRGHAGAAAGRDRPSSRRRSAISARRSHGNISSATPSTTRWLRSTRQRSNSRRRFSPARSKGCVTSTSDCGTSKRSNGSAIRTSSRRWCSGTASRQNSKLRLSRSPMVSRARSPQVNTLLNDLAESRAADADVLKRRLDEAPMNLTTALRRPAIGSRKLPKRSTFSGRSSKPRRMSPKMSRSCSNGSPSRFFRRTASSETAAITCRRSDTTTSAACRRSRF